MPFRPAGRRIRRPQTLAESAAASIRARIVMGDLGPGEALSEVALAEELGVSKTPVREALLRLKAEGLVEIQPQRGTFVFQMTPAEVLELSELREVLEVSALGLAMVRGARPFAEALAARVAAMGAAIADGDGALYRRHDGAFHQAIIDHCGNRFLQASFGAIAFRVQALRNRLSSNPHLNARSIGEHQRLWEFVRGGDATAAAALLRAHIRHTGTEYVESARAEGGRLPA